MLLDDIRSKIENIIAGVILKGQQDYCTAARKPFMPKLSYKYNG